jgi:tetratricopeptide (TPR) repeat protein
MASPKAVCQQCGGGLSLSDEYCPLCGTKVPNDRRMEQDTSVRRCEACGHENSYAGSSCEVCGASLSRPDASRGDVMKPAGRKVQKRGKEYAKGVKSARNAKRRWEPWQLVAGGILAAVALFFLYSELNRGSPSAASSNSPQPPAIAAAATEEIQRLEESIRRNPSDAASMLRLANLLHDNGLRDSHSLVHAIEMYQRYLSLDPGNPDARVDLGTCYFELARVDSVRAGVLYADAAREMEKAFAEHPKHQTAAFNLGVVYLNAGDLEESRKWFQKATEIDPGSALGLRAKELLDRHSFTTPQ